MDFDNPSLNWKSSTKDTGQIRCLSLLMKQQVPYLSSSWPVQVPAKLLHQTWFCNITKSQNSWFFPISLHFFHFFFKCKTLAAPWPPPLHRPLLPAPPPLAAWPAATPLAAAGRARRWATDWRTRSPAAFSEQMVQKGINDDLWWSMFVVLYHIFNVISINLGTGLS